MSFIFIRSSFYHGFFDSDAPRAIPFLSSYYPEIGEFIPNNVHRGQIVEISPTGFILRDVILAHTSTIFVASDTNYPYGNAYHAGDIVVVFGERSGTGTIQAWGVEDLTGR
jgi:hypothetical protein